MDRYEFEVLSYLETNKTDRFSVRSMSDFLLLSDTVVMKCIESLTDNGCIIKEGNIYRVTELGEKALEPYTVKRAVVLAAGFGSRMMPATENIPKPMVTVNGVRIIDTLLDALVIAGINDITIVGGYRFESLKELQKKYPFVRLIENKDYAVTNNISSIMLAKDAFHSGCYLCEADLYISNPGIITKYQYSSNILGSYSLATDDWSFKMENGLIADYRKGNTYCYNYYGISYWTPEDCKKLRDDFTEIYNAEGGKDYFWEFVPLVLKKDNYDVEVRPCRKQDIIEIDNYYELAMLDESYRS